MIAAIELHANTMRRSVRMTLTARMLLWLMHLMLLMLLMLLLLLLLL